MQVPGTLKVVGFVGIFVAEVAVIVGLAAGAGGLPVDGVMVGEDDAIIEVQDQTIYGALSIDRIVMPVDGWVILRVDRDGAPAELIGAAPVSAGENRNAAVVLDRTRDFPERVFVSLLADKGKIGGFEYTTGDPNDSVFLGGGMGSGGMGAPEGAAPAMNVSADKPLVASGEVVTASAAIKPFNIVYRPAQANVGAAFLSASGSSASVQRIDAPVGSWVVIVRGPVGGGLSEVIGSALVPAGHTSAVDIELGEAPEPSEVTVLLLADLGAPGVLEANPVNPSRGVDAPYIVVSYFVQIPVIGAK